MHAAAEAILERSPNLRAAFVASSDGVPVQIVPRVVETPWRVVVSDAGSDPEEAINAVATADRTQPFDLANPPLIRFSLVDLGPNGDGIRQYALVSTNHHVLLDGWSMPLLMRDLLVLYAVSGDLSVLPRVPDYRNFLVWLARQDRRVRSRPGRGRSTGVEGPTLLASAGPQPTKCRRWRTNCGSSCPSRDARLDRVRGGHRCHGQHDGAGGVGDPAGPHDRTATMWCSVPRSRVARRAGRGRVDGRVVHQHHPGPGPLRPG